MNLNGRICGRTADGMILVKLTVGEYLESLPTIETGKEAVTKEPAAVSVPPMPALPAAPVAVRKPGRATPAQRRFNGSGRKPARKPATKNAPRECPHCHESYTPKRKDQTCPKPDCRKKHKAAYMAQWHKEHDSKPATPPPASAPPPDRIATLKAAQARVVARQALGEQPPEK